MRIAWDESRVEGNVYLIERKKLILGRIERNVVRIAREGVIIVRTVLWSSLGLVPRLTELRKRDANESLTNCSQGLRQHDAFESMKDRNYTRPVLAYPNFKLTFILTTYACKRR
jgi:hypothetical protein